MGFVHVNIGLSNPSELGHAEEVRVLVDTGATLSVLPSSLLDNLGIRRTGQRRLRGFGGHHYPGHRNGQYNLRR